MSGIGNFNQLMKKAQQMQAKFTEMQKNMENLEITGTSGGGMVTILMNGKCDIKKIDIDEKLLAPTEGEIISDLIIAAYSDAREKLKNKMSEEMGGILPEGLDLPF